MLVLIGLLIILSLYLTSYIGKVVGKEVYKGRYFLKMKIQNQICEYEVNDILFHTTNLNSFLFVNICKYQGDIYIKSIIL